MYLVVSVIGWTMAPHASSMLVVIAMTGFDRKKKTRGQDEMITFAFGASLTII